MPKVKPTIAVVQVLDAVERCTPNPLAAEDGWRPTSSYPGASRIYVKAPVATLVLTASVDEMLTICEAFRP